MSIASKMSELAAKLADHARRISDLETSPQLPYSSLSDGETIDLIGQEGNVVSTFGKNPDGTYATVPFDGPAPRRLIEPSVDDEGVVDTGEVEVVSDAPGTITVNFSPKQALPSDFAGVDFFYTSGEDRVLLGSVTSLTGGAKTVAVKPGAYEVVAQMRSIPGKTTPLDRKFPVTVAAPVDVKEFDNAKARLTTAQSQIDALLAAPPSAGVSVSATPPSDPKNGDMWLHPVTDDMGNTVHVLQVFQAGAWVTVEDQDAKQIAAGAKASADAATQTANLAKTTAEQAANGTVDVTRLAADSNSTVKESVVGKLWDLIRAKLVAAKQIITEDMLATGSVTASKITASEELSAKAAKFLRITADQIEAGTLNAKVKIGSEGAITVGNNDIVLDSGKISIGHNTWRSLPGGEADLPKQIVLTPSNGIDVYLPGMEKAPDIHTPIADTLSAYKELGNLCRGINFIEVRKNQTTFPVASIKAFGGCLSSLNFLVSTRIGNAISETLLKLDNASLKASFSTQSSPSESLDFLYASALWPVDGRDIDRALKQVAITHDTNPYIERPKAETVTWIGTVEPVNLAPTDIWIEPQI